MIKKLIPILLFPGVAQAGAPYVIQWNTTQISTLGTPSYSCGIVTNRYTCARKTLETSKPLTTYYGCSQYSKQAVINLGAAQFSTIGGVDYYTRQCEKLWPDHYSNPYINNFFWYR